VGSASEGAHTADSSGGLGHCRQHRPMASRPLPVGSVSPWWTWTRSAAIPSRRGHRGGLSDPADRWSVGHTGWV